jgi:membrane-bound lytic murein transglycosylase B
MRTLAAALSLFVVGLAVPSRAAQDARPSFADFLAGIRTEAIERGIRPEVLDQALADIQEPVQSVIERDRSQAETVLTLEM